MKLLNFLGKVILKSIFAFIFIALGYVLFFFGQNYYFSYIDPSLSTKETISKLIADRQASLTENGAFRVLPIGKQIWLVYFFYHPDAKAIPVYTGEAARDGNRKNWLLGTSSRAVDWRVLERQEIVMVYEGMSMKIDKKDNVLLYDMLWHLLTKGADENFVDWKKWMNSLWQEGFSHALKTFWENPSYPKSSTSEVLSSGDFSNSSDFSKNAGSLALPDYSKTLNTLPSDLKANENRQAYALNNLPSFTVEQNALLDKIINTLGVTVAGEKDAKVKVAIVADYRCVYCHSWREVILDYARKNPKNLQVTMAYLPILDPIEPGVLLHLFLQKQLANKDFSLLTATHTPYPEAFVSFVNGVRAQDFEASTATMEEYAPIMEKYVNLYEEIGKVFSLNANNAGSKNKVALSVPLTRIYINDEVDLTIPGALSLDNWKSLYEEIILKYLQ
jgi:hypothetical protein